MRLLRLLVQNQKSSAIVAQVIPCAFLSKLTDFTDRQNMTLKFEYNKEQNIVFTKGFGKLEVSDIREYFETLSNSEIIQDDFIEIVDLENVESFEIDFRDCVNISKSFEKLKEKKRYGGGVIYAKDNMVLSITKLLAGVFRLIGITNIIIVSDKNQIDPAVNKMRS